MGGGRETSETCDIPRKLLARGEIMCINNLSYIKIAVTKDMLLTRSEMSYALPFYLEVCRVNILRDNLILLFKSVKSLRLLKMVSAFALTRL